MDHVCHIIILYFYGMFRKLEQKVYLLPMIVSMILLPAFLAYFLNTEFTKEKEAIKLEERDRTFGDFFATLDEDASSSGDSSVNRIITYFKDTSEYEVSFQLKIMRDSLSGFENELTIQEDKVGGLNDFLSEASHHHDSLNRHNSRDTLITVFTDRAFTWEKGDSNSSKKLNRFPNLIDKSASSSTDFLRFDTDKSSPQFGLVTKEPSSLLVMKRMIPQILFSLFLLLSVGFAYFLVARTLRRERQLAILRNDFMSNMSHELKTPVSTIGVALEALSNFDAGNNPELRKEYINISKMEVERLGLLVDKALNISLYEQGKFVFDKENINIDLEIRKILKTLEVQLDNQKVELHYDTRGSNFYVNVDRTHMINVVFNLIENGIKYSEEQAEIDILISEKSNDIEISISDKGRGIPAQFHDKVFDKFFRVPQGNTHNVKGHGLGLSYVKEVVENLGGSIRLKSGAGVGTTFIIKMPKSLQV